MDLGKRCRQTCALFSTVQETDTETDQQPWSLSTDTAHLCQENTQGSNSFPFPLTPCPLAVLLLTDLRQHSGARQRVSSVQVRHIPEHHRNTSHIISNLEGQCLEILAGECLTGNLEKLETRSWPSWILITPNS